MRGLFLACNFTRLPRKVCGYVGAWVRGKIRTTFPSHPLTNPHTHKQSPKFHPRIIRDAPGPQPVRTNHPGQPTPMPRAAEHRTRAFTLVEIALAMLAFSLGIMSFFSLLSLGMTQGMEAQDHTRAAEFADSTLRGLRAISDHLSETAEANEWAHFWSELAAGRTNVIVAAGGTNSVWHPAPVVQGGHNQVRHHRYTNFALRLNAPSDIVNHAIRYRLDILPVNSLESIPGNNRVQVTLRVWEGETGRSDDPDALIFYTEFADRGRVE